MCRACDECQNLKQSIQREPLESGDLPERPFDVVSADLMYCGNKVYMVYADRLSGYPMANMWNFDPTTKQVIKVLRQYFSMFGKPLKFKSDGVSQFASRKMAIFFEEYGIQYGQSSPYNPQSNGHAERNVKIVKDLLKKTENDVYSQKFLDGISQIRNTPREDGLSPCQVVFGRSIRTLIPTLTEALGTNQYVERVRNKKSGMDTKQKARYDQRSKELRILKPGDQVWIQHPESGRWEHGGVVLEKCRKRAYKLQLPNGQITYRNRKKLMYKYDSNAVRKPNGEQNPMKNIEDEKLLDPRAEEEEIPKVRRSERIRIQWNVGKFTKD